MPRMKTELSTSAMTSAIHSANKTMLGGAAGGLGGWLLSINWMSAAGLFVTLAGFAVSVYFSWARNRREEILAAKREQREHDEHLARIRVLESQYKAFTPKECAAAHIRPDNPSGNNPS